MWFAINGGTYYIFLHENVCSESSIWAIFLEEKRKLECSLFIAHLVITQIQISHIVTTRIQISHSHSVAPKFFYCEILQRNYREMTIKWSFSYNSFVKLSLYIKIHSLVITQSIPMDPKHSLIKGLQCRIIQYFLYIYF